MVTFAISFSGKSHIQAFV